MDEQAPGAVRDASLRALWCSGNAASGARAASWAGFIPVDLSGAWRLSARTRRGRHAFCVGRPLVAVPAVDGAQTSLAPTRKQRVATVNSIAG